MNNGLFRVLAVGDIFGKPGRNILQARLQGLIDLHRIDAVIVNGENAAGGRSLTPEIAEDLFDMGVHVITTGNHIWDNNDILKIIDSTPALLRPANYPPRVPGHGHHIFQVQGIRVCVINLQGRLFMAAIDCPFMAFDRIYEQVKDSAEIIIVDFHAEATSEKRALGWYADGRASGVVGTHTHVQTADEEVLPGGTAYITDLGMTGAFDSVIGVEKSLAIERLLTQTRVRFDVATGNPKINGVLMDFNRSGRAEAIKRIVT